MYAEDGGLLEIMEPLADWLPVVEHSCNRWRAQSREKFRLVSIDKSESRHSREVYLQPIYD